MEKEEKVGEKDTHRLRKILGLPGEERDTTTLKIFKVVSMCQVAVMGKGSNSQHTGTI